MGQELAGERRGRKICFELLSSQFFGGHDSALQNDSVRTPFGTCWCVCVLDVLLSVPAVTVPPSGANGDCEVVFRSDREVVEPQTLSLSRKREAFFFAGSQEDMNF